MLLHRRPFLADGRCFINGERKRERKGKKGGKIRGKNNGMILVRFTEKFEPRPRGLKSESRSMCTGARDPFSNSNLFENNTGSVTGANNKPGSALSVARATKNSAPNRAHRWTNVARFDVRARGCIFPQMRISYSNCMENSVRPARRNLWTGRTLRRVTARYPAPLLAVIGIYGWAPSFMVAMPPHPIYLYLFARA